MLRGILPLFIDIRPYTLSLDETKNEAAITDKTRAIVPFHYAGVGCDMDVFIEIADRYDLRVIEAVAQGLMVARNNSALGTIDHLGAISFLETKNVISGEGGALLVNDERFVERAEIIHE